MRAWVDESSANRGETTQEYLVGAAIVDTEDQDAIRDELRPLLLPGQIKLHWTDESERRRRRIVEAIVAAGPMIVVVTHLSERQRKTERFRHKCLEALYYELAADKVLDVTLESRSAAQDSKDLAHTVALQNQGLDRGVRICHRQGGDDPLLWIPDAVLGSINAAHQGNSSHLEALQSTILLRKRTPESLIPSGQASERP